MGIGEASGENRASTAARMAIASPLLEVSIEGARGILFNIIGGEDMTMTEVSDASQIISNAADPQANVIFGATIDETMGNNIKISVIATGFDEQQMGYASSRRQPFGAFSSDSQSRLSRSQPSEPTQTKIDRTPDGYTQPLTTTQITSSKTNESPFVQSDGFRSDEQPKSAIKAKSATPTTEFEDEFEIPAFLRKKQ